MKKNDKQKSGESTKKLKFTREVFEAICDELADGMSVEDACKKMGVCYRTFRRFVEKGDDDVCQLYTRAREWRGEACLMRIDGIMRKLENGQIDSSTANVLINTEKWKASKFYPKMYGDMNKTQIVDDKGNGINPFEVFYRGICENKDWTR